MEKMTKKRMGKKEKKRQENPPRKRPTLVPTQSLSFFFIHAKIVFQG